MNKTLELLHAACLALSITVSAAAKFLIQWCSPLHGGSELGGTCKLDLTLQTESHTLCRDGEDCPTVRLPDDRQLCNLNCCRLKNIFPPPLAAPSGMTRHSSREWCQEEGEGRREGREAACRGVRDSLLGGGGRDQRNWDEIGKLGPSGVETLCWPPTLVWLVLGCFVLRQMKMRIPTCSMYSYLYRCPFWQKLGIL